MVLPIYQEFTFGSSANLLTFNDKDADFVIKATRRLATKRDIRSFDTPVPFDSGITDYETFVGRMFYMIDGRIYGRNEGHLYTGQNAIRKAMNIKIAQDDSESDYGYLPMKWSENGVAKQLLMKPLYVDIEENRKWAMKPPFKALFKIKYPVITSQAAHSEDFSPAISGTGGILLLAAGIQITANGIQIGTSTGTGSGEIDNAGDYPAWPTITFNGTVTNPKITNVTTGEFIQINYGLTSGESIAITYDNDILTIVKNDGTNIIQYLTSDSTLFTIRPGINALSFTSANMGSGAGCSVNIFDTWPLS